MTSPGESYNIGRVNIELSLANNLDVRLAESGALDADQVRRALLSGVLDLMVDCAHQTLHPRDQERIIAELERIGAFGVGQVAGVGGDETE
jgi:hypothetical protein